MPPAKLARDTLLWACVTFAGLIALALLTGVASLFWRFGTESAFTDPADLRAFYCAGAAVKDGANPYRVEPDRSCQRRVLAEAGLRLDERLVPPAPLPPYALVAFGALARLPYRLAAELWLSANLIAVAISIVLAAKLSGLKPAIAGLALLISAGLESLALGQPIPIVLAALLFAALCARRHNGIGVAIGATIAAVEPHLALPVWAALAIFAHTARKPLAVAAVGLSAVTLLPGVALNLEYVRSVLPQHARSELFSFGDQYALAPLLVALRAPLNNALLAGSASYAAMLAFGVILGNSLRRRTGDCAFVVTAPLASIVLGGPFLHFHQTAVAIPLGLMLIPRVRRHRTALTGAIFAVCLLAIPWNEIGPTLPAVATLPRETVLAEKAFRIRPTRPNGSIEIPYTAFIDAFGPGEYRQSFFELLAWKMPTWLGLMLLLASAYRFAHEAPNVRITGRGSRGELAAAAEKYTATAP